MASSAQAQRPVLDWRMFVVPQYGTRIDYPAGIFIPAGDPEKGVGRRFERHDGRAVLSIYSRDNAEGDTPESYLRKNLRVERSAIGYRRQLSKRRIWAQPAAHGPLLRQARGRRPVPEQPLNSCRKRSCSGTVQGNSDLTPPEG